MTNPEEGSYPKGYFPTFDSQYQNKPVPQEYYKKMYHGEFSVQGTDDPFAKPEPPWPPKKNPARPCSYECRACDAINCNTRRVPYNFERPQKPGICDDPHCKVCKEPVKDEPQGGFCSDPHCKVCETYQKPATGRHITSVYIDDLTEDEQMARCNYACRKCHDPNCAIRNKAPQKSNKEVNMSEEEYTDDYEELTLYEVNTVYGEDRNKVVVEQEHVVAESEKRALLQCKTIPDDWDMDYVTREATSVCTVRVKRKPREILTKK